MSRHVNMIQSAIFAVLTAVLLVAQSGNALARYASIVVDIDTGQVLSEKNADTRNYPASLTKIMTLYLTFEALEEGRIKLTDQLPVSRRASGMAPSKLGLKPGEHISVHDAILALVTKSANDVAVVLAEALGGTEIKFAQMMNAKAAELGMKKTSFRNASGLPNRHQMSTARDMALLGKHVYEDFPQYYHYFNTKSFTYKGRTHPNHNRLLDTYDGVDGIKTGYIRASGFNLVASVEREGHRLIGVVFGGRTSRSRDHQMVKLLDNSFARVARLDMRAPERPEEPVPASIVKNAPPKNPFENATEVATAGLQREEALEDPVKFGWSIQVGAFANRTSADLAAHRAKTELGDMAEDNDVFVAVTNNGKKSLYRARLYGFSQSEARNACSALKDSGTPCLPVSPPQKELLAERPE